MRNLVYYVATTLDGYIAREDGSFHEFPWDDVFGAALLERLPETFPAHLRMDQAENQRFGVVLMGRRTYEVGLKEGITSPYPSLEQYVFSRTIEESPDPAVTLVRDDAADRVGRLKREEGEDIWLCGGSTLASTLYDAGLVDELIMKMNPIVFGSGIPLFSRSVDAGRLTLVEHEAYPSGHMLLRYAIEHGRNPAAREDAEDRGAPIPESGDSRGAELDP